MNLQTLRATVRKILFDQATSTSSRWSDDDLNRFLNEGLLEISRVARRRKWQDFALAAGAESLNLPADLLRIDAVLWRESSASEWERLSYSADPYPLDDREYDEPCYWILQNTILFRPVPDANCTVRLIYFYRFPSLTQDTDAPEPADVDGILIAYAVWQALDFDSNPLSALWEKKYTQQLAAWSLAEQRKYRRRPAAVRVER